MVMVLCFACLVLADNIDVTTVVETNKGVITTTVSAHDVTNSAPPAVNTPTRRQMSSSMVLRMITQSANGLHVTNCVVVSSGAVECTVVPANHGSVDGVVQSVNDTMREYGWQCRAVTNPVAGSVIIEAVEGDRFRQREWKGPTR